MLSVQAFVISFKKVFLQHSIDSMGVLGQAGENASMQANRQASGKQALRGIQSEPCPIGACL